MCGFEYCEDFLVGAFSLGIILLRDVAVMYGLSGTTNARDGAVFLGTGTLHDPRLILAVMPSS